MTAPQTSSVPDAANPATPSPQDLLKQQEKAAILALPDHLFWDLGGNFRETHYSDFILPNLSEGLDPIRKAQHFDVTDLLLRGVSGTPGVDSRNKPARLPRPSFRSPTLVRKSGYFVVLRNGEFNYFRCPTRPDGEYLFRMVDPAPILSEGVFILDKKTYFVTEQDLRRGLVRKARELHLKRSAITYADITTNDVFPTGRSTGANSTGSVTSAIPSVPAVSSGTIQDPYNVGSVSASELAESQAIDLAFDEQVRELLGASSEEEIEWEASENTQSEQADAGSSVPHFNQDT